MAAAMICWRAGATRVTELAAILEIGGILPGRESTIALARRGKPWATG